ncbi:unnamed protein product [Miscanthus lutarioriparius]|uniref:Uncharacterized protein n=1 Tax=Miscanthus lutarioriparius TaxID=422564 RepID=A0A811NA25_9POAL|nr:unnamed protein product [Miscanthus lutarioriparius]
MPRIRLALGRRHRHRLRPVYTEQATAEFPGCLVSPDSHPVIGRFAVPGKDVTPSVSNAGVPMVCVSRTMPSQLADSAKKCRIPFVTHSVTEHNLDNCSHQLFEIQIGDSKELCERISIEKGDMVCKILGFEKRKHERMALKFKAPGYIILKEEASFNKDNDNGKDGSLPIRNRYPWHPVPYFEVNEGYDRDKIDEFMLERSISIAKSRPNDIIIPDPAPQWVNDTLFDKFDELKPILVKDSVRCFLRLFKNCGDRGMSWNLTVTARTLNLMVCYNALRCAKVVLEGKAPELYGMHANPNCINPYGYFPLHEAAERFLFLGVLQKIFLDTTRLLAEKTNNLLEELWNYIENGKLIQSAILLLAAQEQIRRGCSSKINGSSKKDGFYVINKRILWLSFTLRWEKGSNEMAEKLLKERRALIDCTGLLVDVISHTGQRLSSYIQAHSEVPRVEVLEHVSSILKEYGFNPTGEIMDTINLY